MNREKLLRVGWPDYVLSGIGSCLAAFSAGYGIGIRNVASFFVAGIIIATIVGAILQRIVPKKVAAWDGFIYFVLAVLALIYQNQLNSLVPGDGFEDQLRVAGWLCWMLVFGSCSMWRDSTVLFQAVPGIALFGLVGAWDTFRASPFLFFGFLLCFATLFARAHARTMMVSAQESGFQPTSLDAQRPGGFLKALRNGPWRWMAGPEWALVSALAVVLISLIGAPFLQFSLQSVSGFVKIPTPNISGGHRGFSGNFIGGPTNFTSARTLAFGTGPHGQFERRAIFSIHIDGDTQPSYLRYHTYSQLQRAGWSQVTENVTSNNVKEWEMNLYPGPNAIRRRYTLRWIAGMYDGIPIPGLFEGIGTLPPSAYRVDGTVDNAQGAFSPANELSGISNFSLGTPRDADKDNTDLLDYITDVRITPEERQFEKRVLQGAKTDFEKAEAIRRAIASRCTYDLNAEAVPADKDPVQYFLFEGRRGYCDLFASAMTVLARGAGLPARYVTGYAPFTHPLADADGNYTYYDTDYHAWCEIYFKETGWTIFDATDGAAEAPDAGRGDKPGFVEWYAQASVFFGFGVIALIGAFAFLLKMGKRLKLLNVPKDRKSQLEKLYVEMTRLLENRTGRPRRPSQTPFEYLELVKPYLDGTFAPVSEATSAFVSSFYGSPEPTPEQLSEFKALITTAKNALKALKR